MDWGVNPEDGLEWAVALNAMPRIWVPLTISEGALEWSVLCFRKLCWRQHDGLTNDNVGWSQEQEDGYEAEGMVSHRDPVRPLEMWTSRSSGSPPTHTMPACRWGWVKHAAPARELLHHFWLTRECRETGQRGQSSKRRHIYSFSTVRVSGLSPEQTDTLQASPPPLKRSSGPF